MAFNRLIQYSISNAVTLYGLAPLYITNWHVLNASIQTVLTETGTPCHSPTFTRNHLGGGVSPLDPTSCPLQGNQPLGFSIQVQNIRPT